MASGELTRSVPGGPPPSGWAVALDGAAVPELDADWWHAPEHRPQQRCERLGDGPRQDVCSHAHRCSASRHRLARGGRHARDELRLARRRITRPVAHSCTARRASMVDVHGGEFGIDPPALPPGREVELPGRGRTFVRQLSGPERRRRSCCCTAGRRPPISTGSRATAGSPKHFNVVALDHRGHGRGLQFGRSVPARRLCRRRRRPRRRARPRPSHRRRLLDGRTDRPTAVAASPRRRRRPRAVRHELHVWRHATRDDPVPRRRRHGGARRTRPAHPADSRRRRCPRAMAGPARQAVVGIRPGRPATTGRRSSRPGANSGASTLDHGSARSTSPPP